jgi:hypothetical protein
MVSLINRSRSVTSVFPALATGGAGRCGRREARVRTAADRQQRLRRYWNNHAADYDRQMRWFDRHLLADTRD